MSPTANDHEFYMRKALSMAELGSENGEVPVGAVLVCDGKIITKAHNQTELLHDATAHAEMIALTAAFNAMGSKYLPEATLFVTVEPCSMCAGAAYWSKVGRVVYGAEDEKNGYKKTAGTNWPFHPKTELVYGILKEECAQLMKDFFKSRR